MPDEINSIELNKQRLTCDSSEFWKHLTSTLIYKTLVLWDKLKRHGEDTYHVEGNF